MDCLVSHVLIGPKEEAKEVTPELSPKFSRLWWRQVLPIAKQASVIFQRTSRLFVGRREGPCRKTLPFIPLSAASSRFHFDPQRRHWSCCRLLLSFAVCFLFCMSPQGMELLHPQRTDQRTAAFGPQCLAPGFLQSFHSGRQGWWLSHEFRYHITQLA